MSKIMEWLKDQLKKTLEGLALGADGWNDPFYIKEKEEKEEE